MHHNGMVRVASPSVGYDNPYPIHTFEGMRIMNMGIISPNNGSHEEMLSISVEFADLSVTAFLATTRDGKIVIMNRVTQPSRHAPRLSSPAYAG
ncbi:MAG: hypothetical protein HY981_00330 [Candidatus Magasanikbacteria bacterium]|nr:hypothetical protein [Candidatus Magasanikbacteria bacterium]